MAKSPKTPRRRKARSATFLKQWRDFRRLTQAQAAERIEVDQSTLSRIERGEVPYDQDFLEKAAFAYNCEPADLIMRNPAQPDAVWSILDNLRKADPAQREQARAVVDALLRRAG